MDYEKRVAAFIEIYKQQMQRFHQTQQVEWKANFGVWTLLAGATYLAVHQKSVNVSPTVAGTILVIIVVVHFAFLYKIHQSELFDKRLWVRYRQEALTLLRTNSLIHEDEKHTPRSRLTEGIWLSLEVGITALLCFFLWLMIIANKAAELARA